MRTTSLFPQGKITPRLSSWSEEKSHIKRSLTKSKDITQNISQDLLSIIFKRFLSRHHRQSGLGSSLPNYITTLKMERVPLTTTPQERRILCTSTNLSRSLKGSRMWQCSTRVILSRLKEVRVKAATINGFFTRIKSQTVLQLLSITPKLNWRSLSRGATPSTAGRPSSVLVLYKTTTSNTQALLEAMPPLN